MTRERDYKASLRYMTPYAGDTWWALSRDCCEYIVGFAAREKAFYDFYKHARYPDEAFLQTIVGNSPFKSKIARNVTYADWHRGGYHPEVITEEHVRFLCNTKSFPADDPYGPGEMLFARKFADGADDLMEALRQHIIETEPESGEASAPV
ncbi:MAG: beta-1,6-N-acetylglucosaminyltransferase [Candidatus Limnocylindrales bacterium]